MTDFLAKVAQVFGDSLGFLGNIAKLKMLWYTFWATFGKIRRICYTISGHTAALDDVEVKCTK